MDLSLNYILRKKPPDNDDVGDEHRNILANIDKLRANIDGLQEFQNKDGLSVEDIKKGFKIFNMKELKNFESPGDFSDEVNFQEDERHRVEL